jgi:peptide/nickel transport system substrate-binding protein
MTPNPPRARRRPAIAAGLAVVALALTACGGSSSGGSSGTAATFAEGDAVHVALTAEPDTLDPIFDTGLPALNIFYNVFDQLATIDADGTVQPRLATSWTADETLTTWVFTLREGATFQDGSPVTAADVVFTYETAMNDPESRLGGYLSAVDSVVATGASEVTFTLNTPFAPFDRQTTLIPIIPEAAYTELGAEAFGRAPVGSGPYQVTDWAAGDAITLERYDDYWGEAPAYEQVVFTPVPDDTTRANSVQSGDLDIALLGPSNVPAVEDSGAVQIKTAQSNRVFYAGFNGTDPVLSDPDVRKAVDLAIDRQALGDDLLGGTAEPVGQLVAPVSFGFDEDLAATQQDVEAATALLEDSGYDGTPVTLSYPTTGLPQIDQIAQAVAAQLQEIGLTVELDGQEASTFSNSWFAGELPGLFVYAFAPSVMDANLPMSMLLASGGQGYFPDPEVDALLAEQIGTADPDARAAVIAQISQIVTDTTSYAPLLVDSYTYGVTEGLDWTPRPDGMIVFN